MILEQCRDFPNEFTPVFGFIISLGVPSKQIIVKLQPSTPIFVPIELSRTLENVSRSAIYVPLSSRSDLNSTQLQLVVGGRKDVADLQESHVSIYDFS